MCKRERERERGGGEREENGRGRDREEREVVVVCLIAALPSEAGPGQTLHQPGLDCPPPAPSPPPGLHSPFPPHPNLLHLDYSSILLPKPD